MADKNLLLVEGPDDKHVIGHLLGYNKIPEGIIKIREKNGYPNLRETLMVELRASDLEKVGIVVDADTDLSIRWQELCYRLDKVGYTSVPKSPEADGTVIQQENLPKVGIWLMPDNRLPGILEDFVRFLVPAGDLLLDKSLECVSSIPEEQRRFAPQHHSKAHIHTWLAWQKEPGTPLGSAINQRYLDADASHARQFIGWIRRLFDLQPSSQSQPQLPDPTSHP